MDNKILLAVVDALVEDAIKKIHIPKGEMGLRGPRGFSGNDFSLEDHRETITNFILDNIPKTITLTDDQREELRGETGKPGRNGLDGKDGKDFSFEEHQEIISDLIKQHSLKFDDLSLEKIASLKGANGRDGRDGKDFDLSENLDYLKQSIESVVSQISDSLKLRFTDLTEEEKSELRGPRGQRGKTGNDFSFEENKNSINKIIESIIDSRKEQYALRFDNLSSEQKEELRGPRGFRGDNGKDFEFSENEKALDLLIAKQVEDQREFLKLKFSDLAEEDRIELRGPRGQRGKQGKDFSLEESKSFISDTVSRIFSESSEELKLKFSDLSKEDKHSLKLKFEDLTEDERLTLKGARGQRGKSGIDGIDGKDGKSIIGPRGIPGPTGLNGKDGLYGKDGFNGKDGLDAPTIEDVSVKNTSKDSFKFIIKLSDGEEISSNDVKLPKTSVSNYYMTAGGGSSDSSASNAIIKDVACDTSVYIGSFVIMDGSATAFNALADKYSTSNVVGVVESKQGDNLCTIRVSGVTGDLFTGLNTALDYFLSDTDPGKLTTAIPTDSGHIKLTLGQAFSSSKFLFAKGERVVRL